MNIPLRARRAALVLLLWLGSAAGQSERQAQPVATEMRNVHYHFTDRVAVEIRRLTGQLQPVDKNKPPLFDDKNSFALRVESAEIAIDTTSLTNLMNDYVFADKESPLRDIRIVTKGGRLKIKGKLHKGISVPFETEGELEPTSDGRIRIHTKKVKAAHIPAKGLMEFFGVEVADLINSKPERGVVVEEDDLILSPDRFFPPPRVVGRVTAVRVVGNRIVQTFGPTQRPQDTRLESRARNYMAYRGAVLGFGKLTMHDTDLTLIDADPRDPFDFYLDHYKEQLVAGYSKTTPKFGLRTFMVDYKKLRKPPAKPSGIASKGR